MTESDIIIKKKKKGFTEPFEREKIHKAIRKSAERILQMMSDEDCIKVSDKVLELITENEVGVRKLHNIVETALDETGFYRVAESYRQWRNYKEDALRAMEAVDKKTLELSYHEDRSNANADSMLVSTKRSILYGEMQKERYQRLFLSTEEFEAAKTGFIYIHDMKDRLSTFNCCLYNLGKVLKGGFKLSNQVFTEPESLGVAMSIAADHISAAAGQQYGGFSLPQIDEVLAPYAEKSYQHYLEEYKVIVQNSNGTYEEKKADDFAMKQVIREAEQQYQHIEMTLNSVASSRGDYPFTSFTFGNSNDKWAKLISKVFLRVRREGQGPKGKGLPVLFPKLIFLYNSELHGPGKPAEDLFDEAVETAKQCMYPDFLSLDNGYIGDVYKKWGKVISPMGAVVSKNIVTYKYKNELFIEAFDKMWSRINKDYKDQGQGGNENSEHRFIDLTNTEEVRIFDTLQKDFVKVNYIWKNKTDSDNLLNIELGLVDSPDSCRHIRVTKDHPFTTQRGEVQSVDLNVGDVIAISQSQYVEEKKNVSNVFAWLAGAVFSEDFISSSPEDTVVKHFRDCAKEVNLLSIEELVGSYNCPGRAIPAEVFTWNRQARVNFLAGMIDMNGFSYESGGHIKANYYDKSWEIIYQLLSLAHSVGVSVMFMDSVNPVITLGITKDLSDALINKIDAKPYDETKNAPVYARVKDVSRVADGSFDKETDGYVYDVATETEHFEVSGIYSHNCRAFLSPVFKKSGWIVPEDDNDEFEIYRCNLGVVSLNLPMIYQKSKVEDKPFFDVLDYYMEIGRKIGKKTAEYLYKFKASCDPLVFMEGGFDGGNLEPDDSIEPVLKRSTISFGYGGLHELTKLATGKSLVEDQSFAEETMKHINENIENYKKEDHLIWAIYGTPGESWLPLACEQFVKEYGKIKGVTDKGFFTNSFHVCVDEDITPIEKINIEAKFFHLSKGGCINHVRIPSIAPEMNKGIKDQIRYAMSLGLYHSVNHAQNRCTSCGHHWVGDDSLPFEENYKCPKCESTETIGIRRMNGYLGYSKTTQGKTKFNDGKEREFKLRKNL